ncbi:GNAT family N-acetyltransferase [Herbiconiux sp. P15]|uniref:GNAT family N-acetyltransferase n=1 Tax=Herbiconiux liukaitaii TaxID=3342799 RepID=UPI0035B87340
MSENENQVVTHEPTENRYVLTVDGEQVGFAAYTDQGGERVFTHTEIDPAQGGKGYGSILVAGALGQVREEGLTVVPECPFVAKYVEKHHDFDDIITPAADR